MANGFSEFQAEAAAFVAAYGGEVAGAPEQVIVRGAAFTAVLDSAALCWRIDMGGLRVGPFATLAEAFGVPTAAAAAMLREAA